MIIFKSLFFELAIDNSAEYCITHESYLADRHGNPTPNETDGTKVYDYGDIIITTPVHRYALTKVPASYMWVPEVLNCISKQRGEGKDAIVVDLDYLIPIRNSNTGEYHEFFYDTIKIE